MMSSLRYTVESDLAMLTRDGIRLVSDVYRPLSIRSDTGSPVLLVRTPYGRRAPERLEGPWFAAHGYLVVIQDVRGRGDSAGDFVPFVNESADGDDTVAWARRLPGSNGQVVFGGQSYMGLAQLYTAAQRPPGLVAASPVSAPTEFFQNALYRSGTPELSWLVNWNSSLAREPLTRAGKRAELDAIANWSSDPSARFAPLSREWALSAPISAWGERLRDGAPWLIDMLSHTRHDTYWRRTDLQHRLHEIHLPMLHVSSWYDAFSQDTLDRYVGLCESAGTPNARDSQRLVMGPWAHLFSYASAQSAGAGEADFGPNATLDLFAEQLAFFDAVLAGRPPEGPRVRIFVMGENRWRDEDSWPLTRRREMPLYLKSDGVLSWQPPTGNDTPRRYVCDPNDPVPNRGGATLDLPPGAFDQRPIEGRDDVLVYTSDLLTERLEVTGEVTARIHLASSSLDTDVVVRLLDVSPDGYSRNVVDGVLSARFRDSLSEPKQIRPGEAYCLDITLWSTSYVFGAGHRLRVHIAGSAFPRWARNPQTGEDPTTATRFVAAVHDVLADASHPSCLILPVIPAG